MFDSSSLPLKRLKEIKSTWDNEESAHRKSLCQMLENMKNIIREQEEKENKTNITRRLSAFDSSEMSQLLYDQFGFHCDEEKEKGPLVERMMSSDDNSKVQPQYLPPIINYTEVSFIFLE